MFCFPKEVEHDVTISNMEAGDVKVANSIVQVLNSFVYTDSDGNGVTPSSPFENDATNSLEDFTLNGYIGISSTDADASTIDSDFERNI